MNKPFNKLFNTFILILVILSFTGPGLSTKTLTYNIKISKDFNAILTMSKNEKALEKGKIKIIHTKSKTNFISLDYDDIQADSGNSDDKKNSTNTSNIKYNNQAYVVYGDFNFDGISDLAVMDGYNSAHHAPSYKIYLAFKKSVVVTTSPKTPLPPYAARPIPGPIQFVFNADFTRLAQEYSGMFNYNSIEKKIYTSTKDGHCWYQYSEFIIKNNKPVPYKISVEEIAPPFMTVTTTDYSGEKAVKTIEKIVNTEMTEINKVLSFTSEKNKNRILLFLNTDNKLLLCQTDKENKIVLLYPPDSPQKNMLESAKNSADFQVYQKKSKVLFGFSIDNVNYEILIQKNSDNSLFAGMMIKENSKYSNIKALTGSISGDPFKLKDLNPSNVEFK